MDRRVGALFDIQQIASPQPTNQVVCLCDSEGPTSKSLNCFKTVDNNVVYAGGEGGILVYDLRTNQVCLLLTPSLACDVNHEPVGFQNSIFKKKCSPSPHYAPTSVSRGRMLLLCLHYSSDYALVSWVVWFCAPAMVLRSCISVLPLRMGPAYVMQCEMYNMYDTSCRWFMKLRPGDVSKSSLSVMLGISLPAAVSYNT